LVVGNINRLSILAVRGVVPTVTNGIDVLASNQASDFGVGVSCFEGISFSGLFVIQAENVIRSPSFIVISN
jgi:hypothetical protein